MKKKKSQLKDWPLRVEVFEVGPRDGLQSEDKIFTLEQRRDLIVLLAAAGLRRIEVGSFVRSDRIPQLNGTDDLVKELQSSNFAGERPEFWAFVPNEKGLQNALAAKINGASFFVAASETFCERNINRSINSVLDELKIMLPAARKAKIGARVYLSTIIYCPYEGHIAPKKVQSIVESLFSYGAREIVLSDTTGHANPRSLQQLLEKVCEVVDPKNLALHLHDTRGLALANVLQGMRFGIRIFDSSIGGLGGCPYAPGASGNLASEDLANMLLGMGLLRGVDLGALAKAGHFAETVLGRHVPSKVLRTLT